jgi:hypothetical protein
MRSLTIGFWSLSHQALDWVGRGGVRLLNRKASLEEETADAMTGGALVSGVFGAVVGATLSDQSRDMNAIDGAIIGGLFGVCMGIMVGSMLRLSMIQ